MRDCISKHEVVGGGLKKDIWGRPRPSHTCTPSVEAKRCGFALALADLEGQVEKRYLPFGGWQLRGYSGALIRFRSWCWRGPNVYLWEGSPAPSEYPQLAHANRKFVPCLRVPEAQADSGLKGPEAPVTDDSFVKNSRTSSTSVNSVLFWESGIVTRLELPC